MSFNLLKPCHTQINSIIVMLLNWNCEKISWVRGASLLPCLNCFLVRETRSSPTTSKNRDIWRQVLNQRVCFFYS